MWAPGYHACNLAWHLGATLALGWMLTRVIDRRAAAVAMLLFALHPLHTEAVTGIVGRSELMAACFVLVGCALYLDGRRWAAALACLAALLSKESGIALPLVAVLLDAGRRPIGVALRRAWPFALPVGVYAALRVHALAGATLPPPAEYFVAATPAGALLTALDVLGRDVRLMVWPTPLSADYSYPALPIGSVPRALATVGGGALLAAAAWRWRSRSLALALGWLGLTILPVSNLVVKIGVLMAERLLYLPSVAVCLLAAAGWSVLRKRARPAVAQGAVATVALTFAAMTMARNLDWQTPLALWTDTVAKQPRSALAHGNLALSCLVVGDRACAREHLQRAVALNPARADFRAALDGLGP
ncbi:MAG: hypothetical protein JWM53_998 [bacterium]|nr:hypothetical protein [bacterium]